MAILTPRESRMTDQAAKASLCDVESIKCRFLFKNRFTKSSKSLP